MIWLDAQLSPALAPWITTTFGQPCQALRDLGLQGAPDLQIFEAGRDASAIVMTKDSDFVVLQGQRGAPPKLLWITCGNTSNANLRTVLSATLPKALALFDTGDVLVEIR